MLSMEANKIAGAVLLAVFTATSINILVDGIYSPGGDHKPQAAKPADDPGVQEDAAIEEAEPPSLAALIASANAAKGEKTAKRCATCHDFTPGGPNKVGPNLWAILGAGQASREGFVYSSALSDLGGTWTYAEMDAFLADPKAYAPGTRMNFKGIKKPAGRADLIAYLRGLSDSPLPLPSEDETGE